MSFHRLGKGAYGPLLALCALIVVVWAGSYRSIAHVKLPVSAGSTRWEFRSYRGVLSVALIENHPTGATTAAGVRGADTDLAAAWDECYWTGAIAGFSFEESQIWLRDADNHLIARHWNAMNLPYWMMLLLAALAPAHAAYLIVRAHRRTTHNLCGDCGYDLGDGAVCQACAARSAIIGASPRMQLVRPA
jgi:hypothetical protein